MILNLFVSKAEVTLVMTFQLLFEKRLSFTAFLLPLLASFSKLTFLLKTAKSQD